ncbi:MAG: Holliday junction branch migration protein RuvA [Victivallales bacterium]|jgi:Holliday junction DNA helicase RuvA|nr:Holliday junction branch migration protein RuvA [Victivallales bacterium]
MIARLTGVVVESGFAGCVLDVHGVGYEIAIPLSTFEKLPQIGDEATLLIYTHVREDAIVLFGFASIEEKNLFKQLLNVSGIGGKLALSVLSALPVANFCGAVQSSDVKSLSRIPGIGKRTAERLIVELKDKVTSTGAASVFASVGEQASSTAIGDAALALEQLGFKREAIDKVLKTISSELPQSEQNSENLLRQAIIRLKG